MSKIEVNEIAGRSGTSISVASGHKISGAAGSIIAPGQCIGFKTASAANSTQVSGSTFTDITNMTLDYACKVSNSLLYVIVHVHVFIPQQATTWQGAGIKILRGSTALYADAGYGVGHYTDSANNRFMKNISITTATFPGNTTIQTYKVQGNHIQGGSGSVDFNNSSYGGGGRITVMEIAQ